MTDLDALFAAFVVTGTTTVDAPLQRVWDVVSDVERMTEFSPELMKVEWLEGASRAAPGARFAGTSSVDGFEWTRNCTITELDEPNVFAWDVFDGPDERAQSRWRFDLTTDGDRTVLTQRFAHVPDGRSTIRELAEAGDPDEVITERAEMLRTAIERTLEAIRQASEAT
jgi:ligand-binding SRPBCC domain-containing protein